MQMATVFAELERSMIRSRVMAGLARVRAEGRALGRPQVGRKVEDAIRQQLGAGHGILKVAKIVGCGSGIVQRVKRNIAAVGFATVKAL
jgi:DNA invertase Pin-like site-specific DNA recombinase